MFLMIFPALSAQISPDSPQNDERRQWNQRFTGFRVSARCAFYFSEPIWSPDPIFCTSHLYEVLYSHKKGFWMKINISWCFWWFFPALSAQISPDSHVLASLNTQSWISMILASNGSGISEIFRNSSNFDELYLRAQEELGSRTGTIVEACPWTLQRT